MRTIALAGFGLALALSACGSGGDTAANDSNALSADNMMTDDNLMLDENAMNATAGMDANASGNASTQNMMAKDAATNDPDTNLANGL